MGIYVDYTLRAECADEEVRARLERVRARCLDLPLQSVGNVGRLEPIYNPILLAVLRSGGRALPVAVAERLRPVLEDIDYGSRCLAFAVMLGQELPKLERERYLAPAHHLMATTDLWTEEDVAPLVERNPIPGAFTPQMVFGSGFAFEFASILLRRGYLLILDPGEGSETVNLALSTFERPQEDGGSGRSPLWYGQSFTKTQYAKNFVQAHETVCRVLDIVGEEGLLFKGSDTCGYYASRNWKDANKRVNEELSFAGLMGRLMGLAIGNMREEGASIQVIEDNASKAKPVDFSAAVAREEVRAPGDVEVPADEGNASGGEETAPR
jgi:hypothetical protein